MSKHFRAFTNLGLLLALLLAACAPAATQTAAPGATDAPAATALADATEAPEAVTLTYLVDDSTNSQDTAKALAAAFTSLNPHITINVETRPGGTEGDNIVKTRLATGDMTDVFWYNAGSLLQALNPTETLVDLSGEPFLDNVVESFLPTVSQNGQVFGVPTGTAMGGGILYNRRIYEELGLTVPKTWDEFAANNEAIKAAGITPVLATFGDTWTSQLFVLADNYNVAQAVPTFADDYTSNQAKIADTPAAMAGFNYLRQGFDEDWWQTDYATTKFEQGLQILADGEAAHYPMLSFALSTIGTNSPDKVNDIGFFAQPGPDASQNGATIWMPAGTYIPQTTENVDEAKAFLAFIATTAGTDAITAAVPPAGPYMIQGATLPDDVMQGVKDLAAYIDSGNSLPALEFLSPLKGPTLEQICVAVASGQMTAAEGAAAYDEDVERQAQQLGLPGW